MPIQLPKLDNKTFDELMKEMTASIPRYSREWTNFNPSDPGMTVLELLSWISEGLIYRTDLLPEQAYINFLKLVAGDRPFDENDRNHKEIRDYLRAVTIGSKKADIQSIKAAAQKFLKSKYRAVTEEDFRALAIDASPEVVKRVEVFPSASVAGVVIITDPEKTKDPDLIKQTAEKVQSHLDQRRLLGAIVNVRPADYTKISLKIEITCEAYAKSDNIGKTVTYAHAGDGVAAISFKDIRSDNAENAAASAILSFVDSIKGGAEGKGWPYNRALMVYELFNIVEKIDTIKYVNRITEYLFSMESSLASGLPKDQIEIVRDAVRDRFQQSGYPLPEGAKIAKIDDGWKVSDKDAKNDLYFMHASGDRITVYRPFTDIQVNGLIDLECLEVKIREFGNG